MRCSNTCCINCIMVKFGHVCLLKYWSYLNVAFIWSAKASEKDQENLNNLFGVLTCLAWAVRTATPSSGPHPFNPSSSKASRSRELPAKTERPQAVFGTIFKQEKNVSTEQSWSLRERDISSARSLLPHRCRAQARSVIQLFGRRASCR